MNWVTSLVLVLVLSMFIVLGAFFIDTSIIVPAQDRYSDLDKEKNVLVDELKKMSVDSAVIYKKIQLDIQAHERKVLIKYIESTTTNLMPDMIKDVAKALVDAAKNNKIPIDIVVGLCETSSCFNPTIFTEYGQRGLFKIGPKNFGILGITEVSQLHGPDVSAGAGVKLFTVILEQEHGDILETLKKYNLRNNNRVIIKQTGAFAAKVFYNSAKYSIFKTTLKFKLKPIEIKPEEAKKVK